MTITIREIFDNLPEWDERRPNMENLCEALSIPYDWELEDLEEPFKVYEIAPWYCTDTWVGMRAVTIYDMPLAITFQSARKNDDEWRFVSNDMANRARATLTLKPRDVDLLDMNELVPLVYHVEYGAQLLSYTGTVEGRPAKVIKTFCYGGPALEETKDRPARAVAINKMSNIVVRFEDGEEQEIACRLFDIPLRLKKQLAVTA